MKLNTSEMQEFINLDKEKGADKVLSKLFPSRGRFLISIKRRKIGRKMYNNIEW